MRYFLILFSVESENSGNETHHGTLHFLFDASLPFLQVFFSIHYENDTENYPDEVKILKNLGDSLMDFTRKTVSAISNPTHMNNLFSCMRSILSLQSNISSAVLDEFKEMFNQNSYIQSLKSESRKIYEEKYAEEERINELLNTFAKNFCKIYGGENNVQTQLGFSSDEIYSDPESDETLPLGQEFQDHLSVFMDEKEKHPDKRYFLVKKLVQQLE